MHLKFHTFYDTLFKKVCNLIEKNQSVFGQWSQNIISKSEWFNETKVYLMFFKYVFGNIFYKLDLNSNKCSNYVW